MKVFEPDAGIWLNTAIKDAIDLAKKSDDDVRMVFNGIELIMHVTSTVQGVVVDYDEQCKARSEAYRNSPEGIQQALNEKKHLEELQKKHDDLMDQLPGLDFTNDVAILDWFCAYQHPSDTIGVVKNAPLVLGTFLANGFLPNANCGEAFKKDDRENVARWIIGQALSTMRVCAVHQVIHHFVAEWKKKFL